MSKVPFTRRAWLYRRVAWCQVPTSPGDASEYSTYTKCHILPQHCVGQKTMYYSRDRLPRIEKKAQFIKILNRRWHANKIITMWGRYKLLGSDFCCVMKHDKDTKILKLVEGCLKIAFGLVQIFWLRCRNSFLKSLAFCESLYHYAMFTLLILHSCTNNTCTLSLKKCFWSHFNKSTSCLLLFSQNLNNKYQKSSHTQTRFLFQASIEFINRL